MTKQLLFAALVAGLATTFLTGCYSQYKGDARPGDHVGHGSYGGLGPSGHHNELHGKHYFHDGRWHDPHLGFPRPKSPRSAPDPHRH
jgi:hypothetical protein